METVEFKNDIFLPQVVDLIKEGHTVTITARGNSMMPFIWHNRDKLVFSSFTQIHKGDVVLAEIKQGVFVCHRIVNISDNTVRLRGDGNVYGIEKCSIGSVHALLTAVVRNGRTYNLQSSRIWHVYSWLWTRLLPIRRYLLAAYRLIVMHKLPARFSHRGHRL